MNNQSFRFAESSIPREIEAAGFLDLENVVVMGGSALELWGIRKAGDIDLVTSKEQFYALKQKPDWHVTIHRLEALSDGHVFTRESAHDTGERFDTWLQWYDERREIGDRELGAPALRRLSVKHPSGFYVIRPEEMIAMKQAAGRSKDLQDVARYLSIDKKA